MVQRFLGNIHFPLLVAARDDQAHMIEAEGLLKGQILLIGIESAVGFTLVAPMALYHLYRSRFAQYPTILAMIGLLQVLRMIRTWPVTIALAVGRTRLVLGSNLARMCALPLAWIGFSQGLGWRV